MANHTVSLRGNHSVSLCGNHTELCRWAAGGHRAVAPTLTPLVFTPHPPTHPHPHPKLLSPCWGGDNPGPMGAMGSHGPQVRPLVVVRRNLFFPFCTLDEDQGHQRAIQTLTLKQPAAVPNIGAHCHRLCVNTYPCTQAHSKSRRRTAGQSQWCHQQGLTRQTPEAIQSKFRIDA